MMRVRIGQKKKKIRSFERLETPVKRRPIQATNAIDLIIGTTTKRDAHCKTGTMPDGCTDRSTSGSCATTGSKGLLLLLLLLLFVRCLPPTTRRRGGVGHLLGRTSSSSAALVGSLSLWSSMIFSFSKTTKTTFETIVENDHHNDGAHAS